MEKVTITFEFNRNSDLDLIEAAMQLAKKMQPATPASKEAKGGEVEKPTPTKKTKVGKVPTPAPTPEEPNLFSEESSPSPEKKSYKIEEVREKLKAKVDKHREEIKAKLVEMGAPNVSSLDPDNYAKFVNYLNSLD